MASFAQTDIVPETVFDAQAPQLAGTEVPGNPEAAHDRFLGLDSYGWVALAFVIFVAILWKVGAFRALGSALDAKGERVRADLAEAAALRTEAEALKAKAAADAAQARADAEAVIANATAEAQRIVEQAAIDADLMIARRSKLAEERIAAEARSTEAELRARAAEITMKAAHTVLVEQAARGNLSGLTDSAIEVLDRR